MQTECSLGTGEINPLAFSGVLPVDQCQHDCHGHVVAPGMVHIGVTPACRLVTVDGGGEGQATDCLHDRTPGFERPVRSGMPETAV